MSLFARTKAYHFPIILLAAIVLGISAGSFLGTKAIILKPFGDIFLNLIFTFVIPLVFFGISSAIANIADSTKMGKLILIMLTTFITLSMIAAIYMFFMVILFPPAAHASLNLPATFDSHTVNIADQIINIFSVSDISKLFARDSITALIVFSFIIGLATAKLGEKAKPFAIFLQSGTDVFMKAFSIVMYYAPIGFFAYFAVLTSSIGTTIITTYSRATILYYSAGIIYFVLAFSLFALFTGKLKGLKSFWKNIFIPATTALATCSSAASIPANLEAAKKMGIADHIYELVIPIGTMIHKDGSVLGGMLKIAFLFGIFHLAFASPFVIFTAMIVSILVGTVMGAIPSGGMIGEMLILSLYGFPPQALIIIAAISIIIDPLATMLNVGSNTVCCMIVSRFAARH